MIDRLINFDDYKSITIIEILFLLQTPDVKTLEKTINSGQVEELIVQAENELILARKMLGWKPWESLVKPAPPKQWDWPPAQIKEPKV